MTITLTALHGYAKFDAPTYFSSEMVAAHFNITRPAAVSRLKALSESGNIEPISNRVYRLTRHHKPLPVPETNSRLELPYLHTLEPLHIRDACKIAGISFNGNSASVQINKLTSKGVLLIPAECPLPGIYIHKKAPRFEK